MLPLLTPPLKPASERYPSAILKQVFGALACVWLIAHPGAVDARTQAVGTVLEVPLGKLHPTQPSVGHDEVLGKLARWQVNPKRWSHDPALQLSYLNRTVGHKLAGYCKDMGQQGLAQPFSDPAQALAASLDEPGSFSCAGQAPKTAGDPGHAALQPVVVGPGGRLYLIDGHHGFTALAEAPDGGLELPVRVRVAADFSHLPVDAFWQRMAQEGHAWLHDAQGHAVLPEHLPRHLGLACPGQTGLMADDPYRSLVYYARGIGFKPQNLPNFAEFHWAAWLRAHAQANHEPWALGHYDLNSPTPATLDGAVNGRPAYAQAVFDAVKQMRDLAPDSAVSDRYSAKQLGAYGHATADHTPEPAKTKLSPRQTWLRDVNALLRSDETPNGKPRTGGKLWYALMARQQLPRCKSQASVLAQP
ncbi:chromosome partitioning protein ParB [Pusillimonas sp. CC-YST705]|uniref:Chromosome partitioning protein ParB n=1 Tax=Mesopusillimonas faecipullorum TaxID=2755040 RepID=A0ABS8CAX6_9BURK|nr:ParB/Srx family N-terminal domain-containing protein [Mesopusillimonas faecipullorum]MCB5363194.1 chromosome partitioning protein ParB [Mesopusillimonas faecipullorum]